MDRVQGVGSGYEHNFGEVEWGSQEMVGELLVLTWVKHFEHGCSWVAAPRVSSQLVDLIEQEYRIIGLDFDERLDQCSRHRANISSSVAPNFGFISYASESNFIELSIEGLSDGLP